jgi:hypothetical protein
MRTRELELVLDVPFSGRAPAARLANMFPRLTQLAHSRIQKRGAQVQKTRRLSEEKARGRPSTTR